jgi:hypothetical protein
MLESLGNELDYAVPGDGYRVPGPGHGDEQQGAGVLEVVLVGSPAGEDEEGSYVGCESAVQLRPRQLFK